ncbi:MAG TPA: alkaline phosphatase family protein [Thermoanaerobaculia bacterium]|nr:alkaline phosphatase family protein [Thermoanaerobaculia bacterium]
MKRRPGWLEILGAGLLPGLLAGTQVAGLLFFLNPELPFSFLPVARGILLYGGLLGGVSLAVSLPWTWRRPRRAWRILPWGLTLALASAALLDGSQASIYAFFLPSGINDRLVKAALWLSLAALIFFYTALLHGLNRRPYGLRSQLGLGLVALLSVYVMVERREAFKPRPQQPAPRPLAVEPVQRPILWVIGFDAATLDALLPLAGEGRLPFLGQLLQKGAHGRLQSFTPHRPEVLWTSLATGKYPYRHGVLGGGIYSADFLEPRSTLNLLPAGIAFRRWGTFGGSRTSSVEARSASTLWEILSRLGRRSGLLGWPASSPAPANAAFAVTDAFFDRREDRENRASQRDLRPPELAARAATLRLSPQALDPALLASFGPAAGDGLRLALAGDLWRQALARELVAETPDLQAFLLVLPGLREVSQAYYGGFSAAQEGERSHVFTEAAQVVSNYYIQLDEFLSELWESEAGGAPRLLAVVSAYGVEGPMTLWEKARGEVLRGALRGGRSDRSPDGVLLLYSEGEEGIIEPGALLTGARLVDVAPTLLYALGFPVARDFDGQVLTSAFGKAFLARHPLTFLPSYEAVAEPPRLKASASR